MTQLRLGLFSSHGGSNVQKILDACVDGSLDAIPCLLISNNSGSLVFERAKEQGLPAYHLSSKTHPEPDKLDTAILHQLQAHGVNLIVLAGYMKKLGPQTLDSYRGRILNIHPSLLPKYGGQGMYGKYVHESVLNSGDRKTGATIHLVDEEYDTGRILSQLEVPVYPNDTVEVLGARVLEAEHKLYVKTLHQIANGEIEL